MNKSDSERVAAVLEKQGFQFTNNKYRADLIVVNTCGVRQSAEDRVYGLIPRIKKENQKAKIILTGCLVNREDVRRRLKDYVDVWLPITKIFNFQFLSLRDISRGETIFNKFSIFNFQYPKRIKKIHSKYKSDYLNIMPKYQSKTSAFVPIGNGCNNFCSYCVVPYARGREVWRSASDIISEIKNLVKGGYKEIILIAQNVNSYKSQIPNPKSQITALRDPATIKINIRSGTNSKSKIPNSKQKIINFAKLLTAINNIPGDFRIRFATSHPKDMSDELIRVMAESEKVLPQIHLPVQSGDDRILKKMNRNYTAAHYKNLIKKVRNAFKKHRPHDKLEISTDIIVGFPGETKKQFQNTVKLARAVKFDKAYIARYSPRPGTAAARLKDNVSAEEKKRRWLTLEQLINTTDHRYLV